MKNLAVLSVSACLFFSSLALAQVNAVVGGTISDPSGAAMPGVRVTATNVNTGIVTVREANATGNYEFPSLQPGTYTLSAAITGFQTTTFTNVILGQGQQVRQNFTLQVATAAQAIEVVAEADTTLGTTTASVGAVLPDRVVAALPVLNRNVLDLVSTAPGVVTLNNLFGAEVPNFSGTGTGQVNTTRDGLITNDGRYNDSNGAYSGTFTSPDMVEEIRISTNTIDPSMGRGTGQVQMRTRAGANDFHGALFYTNNNSALTAYEYFPKLTGSVKQYQNRNQFGGRVGGPIIKNKAFFFVLVDNQKYLEKVPVTSTVLTEQARQGIFRFMTAGAPGGTPRQNGNAFAVNPSVDINGNILTQHNGVNLFVNQLNLFTDVRDPNRNSIDRVWISNQLLPRLPLPNNWTVGDGLNTAGYQWLRRHEGGDGATGQSPNPNRDHLTMRYDYNINDSHKVNFTHTREVNKGVTGQTGLPAYPDGYFGAVKRTPSFLTSAWTAVLTPTLLNEFRFGYKRDTWIGASSVDRGCCFGGSGLNDRDKEAQEAYDSYPKTPDGGSLLYINPNLGIGQYAPFNVSTPRETNSPLFQFADTMSLNFGAHSFQFGGELNRFASQGINAGGQQTTRPFVTIGNGIAQFPAVLLAGGTPGMQANNLTTAQGLLSLLSGTVQNIVQQRFVDSPTATDWLTYQDNFLFTRRHQQNDWAFFVKDTWKATRNLTLNLGLRYDKYGVPYDTNGLFGRFNGGTAGLFGISGTNFANALWAPGVANGSLTGIEFVGKNSPNPNQTLYNDDWNNLAPSLGFSYNVPWWTSHATVIRGGYGINYAGAVDFLSYSGNIANLPGYNLNATFTPPTFLNLAGINATQVPVPAADLKPFAAQPIYSPTARATNITGYDNNRVTPYVQSFNFSIQHEMARNLTLEVSWVGNKGSKLWGNTQINETNIFENGLLNAFNIVRAGGESPLFNTILNGVNFGGGIVVGPNLSGSEALRRFNNTNQLIANGDVGGLANFLNTTTVANGNVGGIIERAGLPANWITANPQFAQVNLAGNTGNSTYHSLQTVVTQRYAHGVSMQFSYVWSKTIGLLGQRDPRSWALSKGLANNNRTHILKLNGAWDLPFGREGFVWRSAPTVIEKVIGGWQLAPNVQWASGSMLTGGGARSTMGFRATNSLDLVNDLPQGKVVRDGSGFITYYKGLSTGLAPSPNFGGNTTLAGRFTNFQVTDANGNVIFRHAEPGRIGNLAQNTFEGPGQLGFDMSLSKRIGIRESMFFTVRADAINLLNKPQWGNPNMDINSVNFGRITQAGGARTITLNARFDF